MTDIVDWLRVVSDSYGMDRCEEAADEIERLRYALVSITKQETPYANATVRRILIAARAALPKGENDDTENM
jgi:hypothetical protein